MLILLVAFKNKRISPSFLQFHFVVLFQLWEIWLLTSLIYLLIRSAWQYTDQVIPELFIWNTVGLIVFAF